MAASFQIRFTGGDVHPSTVPAHELADLLNAAEQAVTSLAAQNFPDLDPSSVLVGLVGIRDASLGLEFTSNRPDVVAPAFHRLAMGVKTRSCEGFPSRGIAGLEVIASFTARRKCRAEFRKGGETIGEPLAVMDETFAEGLPERPKIQGETVIYGKVERVGGVEPKVVLRLSSRESISCHLSEVLARQVGGRLYEEVGLKGDATWDAGDYSLLYFHAKEVTPYQSAGLARAFSELAGVAASHFSDVKDVEAFVREARYGEGA
jgi:hypothetical protein